MIGSGELSATLSFRIREGNNSLSFRAKHRMKTTTSLAVTAATLLLAPLALADHDLVSPHSVLSSS